MQVSTSSRSRTLSYRCRSLWEGSWLGFKYSDEVTVQHRAASVSRLLPSRHDARECWKRLRASELSADFRLGYGGNEEPSILMKRAQMRGRKRERGSIRGRKGGAAVLSAEESFSPDRSLKSYRGRVSEPLWIFDPEVSPENTQRPPPERPALAKEPE